MPIVLNGNGPVTGLTSLNTTVSDTELGYLDGVTSAIQTQFAGKADTTGNGAWTSYTPTWTNLTVGNGTVTAKYVQIGKLVTGRIHLVFGSTTSVSGQITVTLPTTITGFAQCTGAALDANVGLFIMFIDQVVNDQGILVKALNSAGTYAVPTNSSSTVPFTWTNTDEIRINFTYEAA